MWIEELKTGKLRAVERYTDPLTEKQKKVSITIPDRKRKTLKEAEKTLAQKIEQLLSQKSDRMRLEELADLYLERCESTLKPSTMLRKRKTIKLVMSRLGKDVYLDKMTANHIQSKLKTREDIKEIKAMMRWGYQKDYIEDIRFLDKVETPKRNVKNEKKYLESDELRTLLSQIKKDDYRDLTEFLALTGMRIGEALAITLDDIDPRGRLISINKTFYSKTMVLNDTPKTRASMREIYIQDDLLPLVKKLYRIAREKSLFTGCRYLFQRDGEPINYNGYRDAMHLLGVHPHMLRHTHTALMAEQGVSLEVISRRLGHESSQITKDIYYHVTERQRQKDHEAVRSVSIF